MSDFDTSCQDLSISSWRVGTRCPHSLSLTGHTLQDPMLVNPWKGLQQSHLSVWFTKHCTWGFYPVSQEWKDILRALAPVLTATFL